jgi:hypothetical protein
MISLWLDSWELDSRQRVSSRATLSCALDRWELDPLNLSRPALLVRRDAYKTNGSLPVRTPHEKADCQEPCIGPAVQQAGWEEWLEPKESGQGRSGARICRRTCGAHGPNMIPL